MMNGTQVHLRKGALTDCALAGCPLARLRKAGVRLAIESFSVTANNVTCVAADRAIAIERHKSLDAACNLFRHMPASRIDPARGIVIAP
jgi:hypothetical protein